MRQVGNFSKEEMIRLAKETKQEVETNRFNPLIPRDLRRRLMRVSELLNLLVEREVARNAKSQ